MFDNRVLGLLVELDIPDHLARPQAATELARLTATDADALDRVLRYAAGRGFISKRGGRYRANRMTRIVQRRNTNSWRGWVAFAGGDVMWDSWRHLDAALRGDMSGTEAATGHDFFALVHRARPDVGAAFNDAMRAGSTVQAVALLHAFDWRPITTLCDVGGGTGGLLARVLAAHEHLVGTLVDVPEVVAHVDGGLLATGRCTVVGGSFFDPLPAGCDRYLLLAIVHDWDDEHATTLLRRLADALGPEGRAIVVENVLSVEPRDEFAAASDVMMLALATGRERTRAQFDQLFTGAGLVVNRAVALATGFTAFELARA
jgi:hypothetical protein